MRPPKPSIQAHLEILVSTCINLYQLVSTCIILLHHAFGIIWMHLECHWYKINLNHLAAAHQAMLSLAENCNFRQLNAGTAHFEYPVFNCLKAFALLLALCFARLCSPNWTVLRGGGIMTRRFIHVENRSRNSFVCHLCHFIQVSLSESFASFRSSCMLHLPALQREKSSEVPPFVMLLDTWLFWLTCLQCQEAEVTKLRLGPLGLTENTGIWWNMEEVYQGNIRTDEISEEYQICQALELYSFECVRPIWLHIGLHPIRKAFVSGCSLMDKGANRQTWEVKDAEGIVIIWYQIFRYSNTVSDTVSDGTGVTL